MPYRTFKVLTIVLLGALTACAGPRVDSAGSEGLAPASELSGTWTGSFGQLGGTLYADDANVVLEIKEDGTFTANITPAGGANNLAKASTWTGTVVRKGNRVVFQSSQGPWLTLVHRGNTLYGVANDPASDANIMISLEREGGRGSAYAR
jgi:hypothetical protein